MTTEHCIHGVKIDGRCEECTELWKKEIKVTDPVTGGAKGHKHCTIATIPAECMLEIGKCYANGEEKYGRGNFRKGYKWSLSADALQRHYWQWAGGEVHDNDDTIKEKVHHLAAVAWHAIALMHFEMNGKGTDDIREIELEDNLNAT